MIASPGRRTVDVDCSSGSWPRLGVTLGDPAGIGPELVLRLLADEEARSGVRLVIYGSAAIMRQVARRMGISWPKGLEIVPAGDSVILPTGTSPVLVDTPSAGAVEPGRVSASNGRLACDWIAAATRDALRGTVDAIVTAPICKAAVHAAGVDFPGHTEMLAALTATRDVHMFFWSPELAVGLVTIHIALSDVTPRITQGAVLGAIRQVATAMRSAACPVPRIGVLALNPHAGEGGLFGSTEHAAIAPAIEAARGEGIDATGPLVPDIAFHDGARQSFDAFVAMYHDQGLIPFKMLAFNRGVNVTLGLPFCRTSPDHGTAFDIAWQGKADPGSFFAAVRYARDRVLNS